MTHFLACTVVVCTLVGTTTLAIHQMAEDAGSRAVADAVAVVCGIATIIGILAGIGLAFATLL